MKQQLEMERSNNDTQLTELHKHRYENLKILLDEKELELDHDQEALSRLHIALQKNGEKGHLFDLLLSEIDRVQRSKLSIQLKQKLFLQQVKSRP